MDDPSRLHRAVAEWYRRNARDLPWRGASDPYAILVSEVMLQQTQVDRVIPKYAAFLEAFPTLQALAEAAPADVIRVWAGMGYNARAVRLHRLAAEIMQRHGGRLPESAPELLRLPGIGPYTAAAVACFAFGAAEPVLDTNIYRVLSRVVYGIEAPARAEIDQLAPAMLPRNGEISASDWHQGLMDIGAGICTSSRPRCMLCPLREDCAAAPLPAIGQRTGARGCVRALRAQAIEIRGLRALLPRAHRRLPPRASRRRSAHRRDRGPRRGNRGVAGRACAGSHRGVARGVRARRAGRPGGRARPAPLASV